jgi:hypothetical protein
MFHALTRLIALGAALGLTACEARGIDEAFQFEEQITDLHVRIDAGDIEVVSTDEPGARVEVDLRYHGSSAPTLEVFVDGSLLRVWLSCDEGCWDLHGRVTVHAPLGCGARLETGEGSIGVDGWSGELALECGKGSVRGTGLRSTRLWAVTDQGPVSLDYTTRPKVVDVEVYRGDITVEVPSGTYDVDVHTVAGSVELEAVDADPAARGELILVTHDGDVRVIGH